jgi:hypothetical protein
VTLVLGVYGRSGATEEGASSNQPPRFNPIHDPGMGLGTYRTPGHREVCRASSGRPGRAGDQGVAGAGRVAGGLLDVGRRTTAGVAEDGALVLRRSSAGRTPVRRQVCWGHAGEGLHRPEDPGVEGGAQGSVAPGRGAAHGPAVPRAPRRGPPHAAARGREPRPGRAAVRLSWRTRSPRDGRGALSPRAPPGYTDPVGIRRSP